MQREKLSKEKEKIKLLFLTKGEVDAPNAQMSDLLLNLQ